MLHNTAIETVIYSVQYPAELPSLGAQCCGGEWNIVYSVVQNSQGLKEEGYRMA